jgi:hypothetical protein
MVGKDVLLDAILDLLVDGWKRYGFESLHRTHPKLV